MKHRQRGFSLVTAILLLTALAGLVAYMGALSANQHAGSTLSLQSSRAWFAVRGGYDWMLWQLRSSNACPANGTSFDIGQFRVNIDNCSSELVTEGSGSYLVFDIAITASSKGLSFGDHAYASRTLRASVINP